MRASTIHAFFELAKKLANVPYDTMSFNFFSGRIFTTLRAGLALKVVSSFVKGLMPLRSFVAGLCCTTILHKPGIAKLLEPLRPTAFLI